VGGKGRRKLKEKAGYSLTPHPTQSREEERGRPRSLGKGIGHT